jgi:hypothetical protein
MTDAAAANCAQMSCFVLVLLLFPPREKQHSNGYNRFAHDMMPLVLPHANDEEGGGGGARAKTELNDAKQRSTPKKKKKQRPCLFALDLYRIRFPAAMTKQRPKNQDRTRISLVLLFGIPVALLLEVGFCKTKKSCGNWKKTTKKRRRRSRFPRNSSGFGKWR